jgi:hypothetical protein
VAPSIIGTICGIRTLGAHLKSRDTAIENETSEEKIGLSRMNTSMLSNFQKECDQSKQYNE